MPNWHRIGSRNTEIWMRLPQNKEIARKPVCVKGGSGSQAPQSLVPVWVISDIFYTWTAAKRRLYGSCINLFRTLSEHRPGTFFVDSRRQNDFGGLRCRNSEYAYLRTTQTWEIKPCFGEAEWQSHTALAKAIKAYLVKRWNRVIPTIDLSRSARIGMTVPYTRSYSQISSRGWDEKLISIIRKWNIDIVSRISMRIHVL